MPLYGLVAECYEPVKGASEERFESRYGRWHGFVDGVVYAFTDYGDLSRGFGVRFACCESPPLHHPSLRSLKVKLQGFAKAHSGLIFEQAAQT